MKDHRRRHEKYTDHGTALHLIRATAPLLALGLLDWLDTHLQPHEIIDIECWYGNLFYVIVEDTKQSDGADRNTTRCARMLIGFTVDVKRQVINWNMDNTVNSSGGNCFERSLRWFRLANRQFAPFVTNGGMHHYTRSDGKKHNERIH